MSEITKPVVVCIPVFNGESTIAKIVLLCRKYVDEVIVCDDGSTDMTAEIAMKIGAKVIRHEMNMGYAASLKTLFEDAIRMRASVVVTLNSDGRHNPADIPKLIKRLMEGDADIVVGSIAFEGKSTKIGDELSIGVKLAGSRSLFRVYNEKAIGVIGSSMSQMGLYPEFDFDVKNCKVVEIPTYVKSDNGPETPLVQGLDFFLIPLKRVSTSKPLLLYGMLGVISIGFAFLFGGFGLYVFLTDKYLNVNLMLLTSFFSSIGLLFVLIGIVLWVMIGALNVRY